VSLNAEKTRIVTITDEHAVFAFLGFEFRWCRARRRTMVSVHDSTTQENHHGPAEGEGHLANDPTPAGAGGGREVNRSSGLGELLQVGNSSQAFNKVKHHVERKVRRFAAKQRKRKGFGWKRWSSDIVYGTWGLFRDYRLGVRERERAHRRAKHNLDG